ncbi:hypothetical protein A3715_17480 [Oleiphilus sp. HI0009]|nr:hypothetical protein A3715_17480 [Oleiphilus sp. HI0009]
MQYIPHSTKQARIWVDAVSKSLAIDKVETAVMYANICGFKTWESLIEAIQTKKPSMHDENCSNDIIESRKAFYIDVLMGVFGMNDRMAEHLIESVPPSSNKKAKTFSIDRDRIYEPADNKVTLGDMMKKAGISSNNIDDHMSEFLKEALGEEFDSSNFVDRLRISKPIFPSDYYNMLKTMGWDIDEESYRDEYEYGEESFCVITKKGIEIPVYICSLSRMPLDHDDAMANEVMEIIKNHCEEVIGSGKALLFWGQPIVKEIDHKWFSLFGMTLQNDEWTEFFLNMECTIESVFEQTGLINDIDNPDSSLEDKNRELAIAFNMLLANIKESQKIRMIELGSATGWSNLMIEGEEVEWDNYHYFGTSIEFNGPTKTIKNKEIEYVCEDFCNCETVRPMKAWASCIHLMDNKDHLGSAVVHFIWAKEAHKIDENIYLYGLDQHDMTLNEISETVLTVEDIIVNNKLSGIAHISGFEVYKDSENKELLRNNLMSCIEHCFKRITKQKMEVCVFDIDLDIPENSPKNAKEILTMGFWDNSSIKKKTVGTRIEETSPFSSNRRPKEIYSLLGHGKIGITKIEEI